MIRSLTYAFSGVAAMVLTGLFGVLMLEALPGVTHEALFSFGRWDFRSHFFSSLSMISGTAVCAGIAVTLAFPVGVAAAIFVSEFLNGPTRAFAKVAIELLAGVPSVVYGLLGAVYLREWIFPHLEPWGAVSGDSLLTGGILLAVMILPTIMTFSDDALRCVPRSFRETGWGLGMSKGQTILHIVLPQARAGIFGSALLGMGRAIGETIAVFLVVGRADRAFSLASLQPSAWIQAGQTITTKLGGSEIAIAYSDARHWSALMAVGTCLWVAVGVLAWSADWLIKRVGVAP